MLAKDVPTHNPLVLPGIVSMAHPHTTRRDCERVRSMLERQQVYAFPEGRLSVGKVDGVTVKEAIEQLSPFDDYYPDCSKLVSVTPLNFYLIFLYFSSLSLRYFTIHSLLLTQ